MKYIKLIIITIIDFFFSLFRTPSKRKKSVSLNNEKESKNTINKKETNFFSSTSPQEEPNTNILVNEEISEELKKLFKKYLELITGIKIKDATLEETKEIERIRLAVLPIINEQIKSGYLIYNSEIEVSFIKNITKEIKKKDILPIKKNLEIKQEKIEEIKQEELLKNSFNDKQTEQKEEQVTSIKQDRKDSLEEKVIAIKDVQIIYKKKERKLKLEESEVQEKSFQKENKVPLNILPKEKDITKDIDIETIVIEQEKLHETILQRENEEETKVLEEKKDSPKENLQNEDIQAEVEKTKAEEKQLEEKQENKKEEEENNHYLQKLIDGVSFKIKELKELLEKEELTIEDYDFIEEKIEELTSVLETYKILNKLDNQEQEKINEQLNNVQELKEGLENTRKEDYKNEESIQNETMKQEEINRVNSLLQEVYSEHDKDLSAFSLSSIDDLSSKTEEEIKLIEKELLKVKLRKAAKVLEPTFLVSLPFIRNKYFLYFTSGIFLHNHLGIINSLYDRKEASFKEANISPLMKASEALNNSISLTEDNLIKVREIKEKYVDRYPELKYDEDFNKSINKMEMKLKSNYIKYVNKENRLKRIKKRSTKINKNIKKKVLTKDKKKEDESKKDIN